MHSQLVQAAEEDLEDTSGDLSTSQLSSSVHRQLAVVIETIETRISIVQKLSSQWKDVEDRKTRLREWLEKARVTEQEEKQKPADVDISKAKGHLDQVKVRWVLSYLITLVFSLPTVLKKHGNL